MVPVYNLGAGSFSASVIIINRMKEFYGPSFGMGFSVFMGRGSAE